MATEADDPRSEPLRDVADEDGAADADSGGGQAEKRHVPMSLIDRIGRERAQELMAEAVRKAVEEHHALGLPTTHGDGKGRYYRLYPDGRQEYLDEQGDEPSEK
ncbi:hypothetical protein [Streptodolium elevatio]|uniref:Uncharacterized protein n=1 Tax=Streptodolium elevatio TaxID=3157996 RepID=A0ABV3DGF5_9ACTN